MRRTLYFFFFFFNDTATTEIYTLSLHDALPICETLRFSVARTGYTEERRYENRWHSTLARKVFLDRKSTRLNSSHGYISYAVFCLKKKKRITTQNITHTQQLLHSSTRVSLIHVH